MLVTIPVLAQQTIRSTTGVNGASATIKTSETTYVIQQSVGQASVIGQHTIQNAIALQGVIQPPIIIESVVVDETSLQAVVFPNPFESYVTVRFSEESESAISILLYDVTGRIVYQEQKQPSKEIRLDFEGLSSAAYVLYISQGGKEFTANLLKN